jgi:hypothetical protein
MRSARRRSHKAIAHDRSSEGFRMTDHRDGSACVGAVVRKPPGKESAEDDVVTMTRALWRFDHAMFAQRLVYSPWFSRLGSQALRCRLLAHREILLRRKAWSPSGHGGHRASRIPLNLAEATG